MHDERDGPGSKKVSHEGVAYPVEVHITRVVAERDADYIETAGKIRHARVRSQKMCGGEANFPLLAAIDCSDGITECLLTAVSNFDKYQKLSCFGHDQIDFAELAEVVAVEQYQSLVLQIQACTLLLSGTRLPGEASAQLLDCHDILVEKSLLQISQNRVDLN